MSDETQCQRLVIERRLLKAERDVAIAERNAALADAVVMTNALLAVALPMEVLCGQIQHKRYTEMTSELQDAIIAATISIRQAVASHCTTTGKEND